jgi:integrase
LEAIRGERDQAKQQLKQGVNPGDQRKADKLEAQARVEAIIAEASRQEAESLTVRSMYEAWMRDGVARADGNAALRRGYERDILPSIGTKPVREVTEHDLRALLRLMVNRGVYRSTVRTYHDIVQMFTWAEKRKPWRGLLIDGNPAELVEVEKLLPPGVDVDKPRERVLSAAELRELHEIFQGMEDAYAATPAGQKYETARPLKKETQLALWLCLGTTCRIGELLMSRWQDVDLSTGEWFVPADNTKTGSDWRVYLSSFALRQFKALKELTGSTPYCFPARAASGEDPAQHIDVKSVSKQVGDRQTQFKNRSGPLKNRRHDNSLVLSKGKSGEWTPHDLRRTGATMMQALGVLPDIIDRCQNHVLAGSRIRRHYLHYDYAAEKREAWAKLGERLEAILSQHEAGTRPSPSRKAAA